MVAMLGHPAILPIVLPLHPRGRATWTAAVLPGPRLLVIEPLGYVRFLSLVRGAAVVVTDSGGIQEETTILGMPCLTVRPNTERPMTITHGTNRLIEPMAWSAPSGRRHRRRPRPLRRCGTVMPASVSRRDRSMALGSRRGRNAARLGCQARPTRRMRRAAREAGMRTTLAIASPSGALIARASQKERPRTTLPPRARLDRGSMRSTGRIIAQ